MSLLTLFFLKIIMFSNSSILDPLMSVITEFGSELFYMIIIPPIFWCVNKKFGFRLLVIVSIAAYIATALKNLVRLPRPNTHLWKTTSGSYAFPSGHSYGTATLWTYLMIYTRNKALIISGIVIIILVAVSRVYLGVHYPGDVLAGVALGICTVAVFLVVEPVITRTVTTWSFEQKLLFAIIMPLLLFFYACLFFTIDDRGVRLAGALLGIIPGYVLENEYIKLNIQVPTRLKVMRIFLGLFIAFNAYFGFRMLMPNNITTELFSSWLGGFSVMFISPWVFTKIEKRL